MLPVDGIWDTMYGSGLVRYEQCPYPPAMYPEATVHPRSLGTLIVKKPEERNAAAAPQSGKNRGEAAAIYSIRRYTSFNRGIAYTKSRRAGKYLSRSQARPGIARQC